MNPLTNMRNLQKLTEKEIDLGVVNTKSSFHYKYRDSSWIFIGGLNYDLSEGDIICVFSEFGEIVTINLIRDKKTGNSKGFAFLCYEDQRSTILAVDNLNGIRLAGRLIRVDHVEEYKVPKELEEEDDDEVRRALQTEGCLPKTIHPAPRPPDHDEESAPTPAKVVPEVIKIEETPTPKIEAHERFNTEALQKITMRVAESTTEPPIKKAKTNREGQKAKDTSPPATNERRKERDVSPTSTNERQKARDLSPSSTNERRNGRDTSPRPVNERRKAKDTSPLRSKERRKARDVSPLPANERRKAKDISPSPANERRKAKDISLPPVNERRKAKDISPPPANERRKARYISPPPANERRKARDVSPPPANERRKARDLSPPAVYERRKAKDISPPPANERRKARDVSPPTVNERRKLGDSNHHSRHHKRRDNYIESC